MNQPLSPHSARKQSLAPLSSFPTYLCMCSSSCFRAAVSEDATRRKKFSFWEEVLALARYAFLPIPPAAKPQESVVVSLVFMEGNFPPTTSTFKNSRYFIAFCSIRIHKQLFERNTHTILPVWKKKLLDVQP